MNTLLVIVAVASVCFLVHAAPPGDDDCPPSRKERKQDFSVKSVKSGTEVNGNLVYKANDGKRKVRVAFLLGRRPRPKFTMIALSVKFTKVKNAKALFKFNNLYNDEDGKQHLVKNDQDPQVFNFTVPSHILNKVVIVAICELGEVCNFQIMKMDVCLDEDPE